MADNTINWKQLQDQSDLPDGDRIAVQDTAHAVEPDKIKIELELGTGITWWKGLLLQNSAFPVVLCQCQDKQTYSAAVIDFREFQSKPLELWKAKFAGVHWASYVLETGDQHGCMQAGHAYLFKWVKDG